MRAFCEPDPIAASAEVSRAAARLAAGAAAWARRSPAERAGVALRTAGAVARAADAWSEAAIALKRGPAGAGSGSAAEAARVGACAAGVRAEEIATGPLATLRLLLVTAGSLAAIGRGGLPWIPRPPRLVPAGGGAGGAASHVAIDLLPARGPRGPLYDAAIFAGHQAIVHCVDPGGLEAFERSWREEVERRPSGGAGDLSRSPGVDDGLSRSPLRVAVVLGAGNVTGLGPADCVSQIFEHGRAALLKLHPLHAPLEAILRQALEPLVEEGLLAILVGGVEVARDALVRPEVGHVHLTGGAAAFDALVWGGRTRTGPPVLRTPLTCELGNVSPWVVMPGRYRERELLRQADMVAASIVNNTSFNCIATKLVVTAGSWDQRDAFLAAIRRRLEAVPPRPGWYPGSGDSWEALTDEPLPKDGSLPWHFRTGLDPDREPHLVDREWFVPVAAEVPLAADSVEAFCGAASGLLARLPGSLAASVTLPGISGSRDARRAERFLEHLRFGVVAVNTWSALGYSLGSLPWGGFPGGTLAEPKSGIGFVHDPLLLPLVHHSILRGPLASRLEPPWFPWHPRGETLTRGLVELYGSIARGKSGLWPLARLLPTVLAGG